MDKKKAEKAGVRAGCKAGQIGGVERVYSCQFSFFQFSVKKKKDREMVGVGDTGMENGGGGGCLMEIAVIGFQWRIKTGDSGLGRGSWGLRGEGGD
jgi:hypothetical protein